MVKSTWPGVSIRLMRYFWPLRSQKQVIAAAVMVIPRSRYCGIQSVVVLPSSTSPMR